MVDVFIRPVGVNEVIANIRSMERPIEIELGKAMADIVFKIQFDAKQNAPFKTGLLRNSIFSQVFKKNILIHGRVTSPVHYSAVQEFGSSAGIVGKMYLTRAAISNKQFIMDKLGDAVRSATIRTKGKNI